MKPYAGELELENWNCQTGWGKSFLIKRFQGLFSAFAS
jgi:hypothetical protein